ncbi:hypothetical protein FACS189459_0660 [Bacilli bacterium]|nr:hypothetical protein FACS189459_0660 [Bacilli bacterium]
MTNDSLIVLCVNKGKKIKNVRLINEMIITEEMILMFLEALISVCK